MATITFDGPTKLITIGYDGPTTVVSWQQIYSRWKDWVASGAGPQWDEAFSPSIGGNDLGDGISLDGYFFIRNDLGWRVIPADIDHALVVDGNGYGFDPSTAVYLPRSGRTITIRERQSSRSQVIQADASLLEASSAFNGFVWYDPASPDSGTTFPIGTSVQPVNNFTDAMSISRTYGLQGIRVLGDLTLTEDAVGYEFVGSTISAATVTLNGFDVMGSAFRIVTVTGDGTGSTGDYILREALAENLNGFRGLMVGSGLIGTLTLSGDATIADSWSQEPGNLSPVLDYNGMGHNAQLRRWTGSVDARNMVTGSVSTFDLAPGRLILDASCTGGDVKVRGSGEPIVDSTGGAVTVDDDGFNPGGVASVDYDRIRDSVVPHMWAARK